MNSLRLRRGRRCLDQMPQGPLLPGSMVRADVTLARQVKPRQERLQLCVTEPMNMVP